MPNYEFLNRNKMNLSSLESKMKTLKKLHVPYTDEQIRDAEFSADAQAKEIAKKLAEDGITTSSDTELIAMIAYLQKLGRDEKQLSTEKVAP